MAIEYFENALQESMRHQHARGHHIHDGDSALCGDSFEVIAALWSSGGDSRTFTGWVARVQDKYGNVFLHRRQQCRRVQDLGAEIGEFGGFVEADCANAARVLAQPWVSGHHAVDVRPDLDRFCSESGANDSGGEI